MAYKEDYSKMDGIWRTVGGRRVFIKEGQSLIEAMKESGKFQEINDEEKKYISDISSSEKMLDFIKEQTQKKIEELEQKINQKEKDKFIQENQEQISNIELKIKEIKEKQNNIKNDLPEWRKEIIKKNYEEALSHYEQELQYYKKQVGSFEQLVKDEIGKKRDYISKIDRFKEIAHNENLMIIKSPYSDSFYAVKYGDKIDWGTKPEGSYRLADHWNWGGGVHCPTDTGENFGLAIARQENGKYTKIF